MSITLSFCIIFFHPVRFEICHAKIHAQKMDLFLSTPILLPSHGWHKTLETLLVLL